jgi:hypothetical protein
LPYEIIKDADLCSESKPWAVVKEGTKKKFGCHATKGDAQKQMDALYANETDAAAQGAFLEASHLRRVVSRPYSVADLPVPEVEDQHETTDSGISLVTMKSVPLMCVGMEFPASTGPVTFDFGDIDSAVRAGADPTIPRPRVKLGHTDPRYNDTICPHCKEMIPWSEYANDQYVFDAMPNFGFLEAQNAQNDGAWLYADLVDVPEWLAEVMPVAYPSRSIEGWFGYSGINEKEYKFLVTDLALLGVVFPGCMNLADLPSFYGKEKPNVVQFDPNLVEVAV